MAPSSVAFLQMPPGHVAEARAGDGLALNVLALVLEDILQIVHRAVARGLGTDQTAAVGEALAGQHAVFKAALKAPILAVQVSDLPGTHAHVAGGHVDVGSDVTVQGLHEALAKAHDLCVGLAGGVEVGAALGAADGQAGQGVFENLLKAQEFDDAGIHVLLEPQSALVGADGSVELAAVADVGMPGAVVRHPHHTEGEHPLRLYHPVQKVCFFILRMLFDHRLQGREDLLHGLDKFRLTHVFGLDVFNHTGKIGVHLSGPPQLKIKWFVAFLWHD